MNADKILKQVQSSYLRNDVPKFRPGNTVRVHVKVVEGESERIQPFEGVVIVRRGGGISETFTVRKISFGVGIERTFPVHSPRIVKIEVIKTNEARRARLYYLRKLSGKAARLTEKENVQENAGGSEAKASAAKAEAKEKPEPALTR